ncbi:hypothetical protein NP233_g4915 [Leucocoprinus birnbaumii]|uniref:DUF6593 domain-containing protein n=1 Tax=Leucocoprinus birnbaumii TaxID=56174 RepID=A0AAD5VTW3_9AGAR|nr:hypothetical protein NP233_g4915 [Leucocoprinus birnbaumii]
MHLTLTTRNPRNSDYIAEDGHVLYKVDKPHTFTTGTVTMRKSAGESLRGQIVNLGFMPRSNFTDGVIPNSFLIIDLYLRANFFGKRDGSRGGKRIFTASDGRQYTWKPFGKHLELYRNDGTKTLVVKYKEYRSGLVPFQKQRSASLEIDSSCIPILDEIIMTFIYCEKLRKDRRRSNSAAAAGAAAS